MRFLDELMLGYQPAPPEWRRWALTCLEGAEADADVWPRLKFLREQASSDDRLLSRQALFALFRLLPWQRAPGSGPPPLALSGMPVLDGTEMAFGPLDAPGQASFTLCATARAVKRVQSALARIADPFGLALGLAHRPGSGDLLLSLVEQRSADTPELALISALLPGRAAGKRLVAMARTAPPAVRISLLRSLPGHPERDWVKPFETLTAPDDPWVGLHALEALAQIQSPKAGSLVVTLARKLEAADARRAAVRACTRVGGIAALDFALEQLEAGSDDVRADALGSLLARGYLDARLDRAATALAGSPHPRVRAFALAIVVRAGAFARLDELDELTRSDDPKARAAATIALSCLDHGRAQALLERLASTDTSRTVACSALRGLMRARGPLAVGAFRAALARGGLVARAAAEILCARAVTTPAEVMEIVGVDPAPGPGLWALAAAARSGAREGVSVLAGLLKKDDAGALAWAAEAMYVLGSAAPRRRLSALLSHPEAPVRIRGSAALALAGDRRGLRMLRRILTVDRFAPQALRALVDMASVMAWGRNDALFADATRVLPPDDLEPDEIQAEGQQFDASITSSNVPWSEVVGVDPGAHARWESDLETGTFTTSRMDELAPDEALEQVASMAGPRPAPGSRPAPAPGPSPASSDFDAGDLDRMLGRDSMRIRRPAPRGDAFDWSSRNIPTFVAAAGRRGLFLGPAVLGVLAGLGLLAHAMRTTDSDPRMPAAASVAALPDLGFFPFATQGTFLVRGSRAPTGFMGSDVFLPGDHLTIRPGGTVSLRSSGGSALSLGASADLRFLPRSGRAHRFALASGRLDLDWKEPVPVAVEIAKGTVEGAALALAITPGWIELRSGSGRWTPKNGPAEDLSAGTRLDVERAR